MLRGTPPSRQRLALCWAVPRAHPGRGHATGRTLDGMPVFRPYTLTPGQQLEVEVVQPNGARALVTGKLDAVPDTTHGRAMRIRVVDAKVQTMEAEG
jgi:hypothetical protein